MSEEDSPDLTRSWVFVDSEKTFSEDPASPPATSSGVEEVPELDTEPQHDSDTDSISVISESGCSYKTDEEEPAVPATQVDSEEVGVPAPEEPPEPPEEAVEPPIEPFKLESENKVVDKLLYFATSATCALILIAFSILVQHYFYDASNVNNKFSADFEKQTDLPVVARYVQSVKSEEVDNPLKRSYGFKRKSQDRENVAVKRSDFHDRITAASAQIENNDLRVEDDVKSNYKPSKNKSPARKLNKENCDDTDRRARNDEFRKKTTSDDIEQGGKDGRKFKKHHKTNTEEKDRSDDEKYNRKFKELKMKEDFLRKKEKFLIEKEHDLKKQEMKLNKEKHIYTTKNKYEKTTYKKDKEHKHSSEEYNSKEKKDKYKQQKKYDENNNAKKNKKNKKKYYDQNQYKIIDDTQHKKRNISGQWYLDLHKARNNIRQKEHASDWVFDRAHLRNLRRNKAHWYFQWMVDRARLRVK